MGIEKSTQKKATKNSPNTVAKVQETETTNPS